MDERTSQELLAAWIDGSLDPAGAERLLAHVREDAGFCEEAARLKSLERLLRVSQLGGDPETFVREVGARCGFADGGGDFVRGVRWRLGIRRWAIMAAAASVVFCAGLAALWRLGPVATVVRTESAMWREGQATLVAGDKLARGRFALAGGLAALRFDGGAEWLVEGPAEFELLSPGRVRLHSGSAFAHVPERATGFTVESAAGRVIDRGTDFGVRVSDGGMEVHVLKGLVEAGRGSALQPVRANEALRISSHAVSEIPADARQFRTELPPMAERPIAWARWSFDEGDGVLTAPAGAGLPVGSEPARLLSLTDEASGPQWTTGVFGSALHFDGEDDYVQTDFPGISGSAARTVAFWVKAPRDFQPKNGYAIVSWGSKEDLTEGWQISINPKEESGPVGRLRVARIGGPIIGATDLRDDRWHHVAVIFYGGELPQLATQVLIYIDGELEPTERKGFLAVRTDTSSQHARKVAFGLNIGPRNPNPALPPQWRVFRGSLDEIFICDAALSQRQVRELMARNHTSGLMPEPEE